MTDKSGKPRDPTDTGHPDYEPTEDPNSHYYLGPNVDEPDPSEPEPYKVGPGYPPNEHKWKKGCKSPYPNGRPRKPPSMKPDLRIALEAALNEKVVITKGKKKILLSKAILGIQQLVNQFAKGDRHARRDLFQYAAQLGVDLQAKEIIEEALGVNEQAIVDAALRRRAQQTAPEGSPDDHVKAPPDLLDDDVLKPETDETPHAAPQPEAKKPPEPVLDEHGRPLPVSDARYVREIARRKLAEQKKNQGES